MKFMLPLQCIHLNKFNLNESEAIKFYNLNGNDITANPDPWNHATLLEYLVLVSIKSRPTITTYEFINYELQFDLNNPYTLIKEIIGMLYERDNAADNCEPKGNIGKGIGAKLTRKRCTCMVNCRFNKQLIDPKKSSQKRFVRLWVEHNARLLTETTPLPTLISDFEAFFMVHIRGPYKQQTAVQRYTIITLWMLLLQVVAYINN